MISPTLSDTFNTAGARNLKPREENHSIISDFKVMDYENYLENINDYSMR